MKLNKKQVKALETLLNYVSYDECENFDGSDDHIWNAIRPLYELVFGKADLAELENEFKQENTQW